MVELAALALLAERSEYPDTDEIVLKVRSGEGQEEMAGVGDIEGDGEPSL